MNRSFLCSILYFVDRGKAEADALILNGGFLMDYNNYDRGYAEPSMSASDYMTRTYRWMAGGLLVTFAMAYITATTPLIYLVDSLYFLLTIGELALVFMLSARVQRMSIDGARAAFFGYAILNGMVLSYYFLMFSVGTLVMAFLANKPFVMAPGMGLNSFFAVIAGNVAAMLNTDYTSAFQAVLCIILVEGIVFLLLSIFNIRDKIVTAIPLGVRLGIGPAIGLMLMNIGLGSNVGIYAEGNGYTSPFYVMRDFFGAMTPSVIKDHMGAEYSQMVLTVVTMFIGLFVIILLAKKGVKAAVLVGMLVASVIYWAGCFLSLIHI